MRRQEIVACTLELTSRFCGENTGVSGTVTLADGTTLKLEASGSASARGCTYDLTYEDGTTESFWWTEVEWLDKWLCDHWPDNDLNGWNAVVEFGPDQPWTQTLTEVPDEDDS